MSAVAPGKVQIGDSVLYQALNDEVVLLNMSSQQYYGLDDIGSRMWDLLLELGSVTAVEARLAAEFDVEPAKLSNDLRELVEKLVSAGLLRAA